MKKYSVVIIGLIALYTLIISIGVGMGTGSDSGVLTGKETLYSQHLNGTIVAYEEDDAPAGHVHDFSEATCTSAAKCDCGAIKGSPKGHSWKEATCSTRKTCTECFVREGTTLAHVYLSGKCTSCGMTEAPAVTEATTHTSVAEEATVWITETGDCYHAIPDCGNTKKSWKVTLVEAKGSYEPCEKCFG